MDFKSFLPFQQALKKPRKQAQTIKVEDQRAMAKLFRSVGLAIGFTGGTYIGTRINFEPAPYDFDRIIQAVDTDSYVKQAFNKYRELLWKEGWDIVGENPEAVDYLYQRIAYMELSMGMPFQNFLYELGDQLLKFANCFVVKVRNEKLLDFFPLPLNLDPEGRAPIVGYQLLPGETVEIMRNYHNKPLSYRQNIWGNAGAGSGFAKQDKWSANLLPRWKPYEVIHMYFDKRPGRAFGTPFLVSVMDDILALRQVEEDIQNLVHRELFPLYKYKVGTEEHPAEPEEIEQAVIELEHLRVEGGLVLPDRHDVEVIGSEGMALDANPYLAHFKERVCVGLGLAPHHLGMLMNSSNRSTTDRLDIALYDKVKSYQRYISGVIQLQIFNEILLEGGFDPYRVPDGGPTDRCIFQFNEIDVDSQVKKENHILQKWTSDILMQAETRIALGLDPTVDEDQLYTAQSNRMLPAPGKPVLGGSQPGSTSKDDVKTAQQPALAAGGNKPLAKPAAPNASSGGANNVPRKPDAAVPSTGGRPNKPNKTSKQVGNKSRPANQYGSRLSPNIRHSEEWLEEVLALLEDDSSVY